MLTSGPGQDEHVSTYTWGWIYDHQNDRRHSTRCVLCHLDCKPSLTSLRYKFWGSEIKENPPSVHYDEIMANDVGVGKWTSKIVSHCSVLMLSVANHLFSVSTDSVS
jgi:hypothetical protein